MKNFPQPSLITLRPSLPGLPPPHSLLTHTHCKHSAFWGLTPSLSQIPVCLTFALLTSTHAAAGTCKQFRSYIVVLVVNRHSLCGMRHNEKCGSVVPSSNKQSDKAIHAAAAVWAARQPREHGRRYPDHHPPLTAYRESQGIYFAL